jgi:hypothetical protein
MLLDLPLLQLKDRVEEIKKNKCDISYPHIKGDVGVVNINIYIKNGDEPLLLQLKDPMEEIQKNKI